MKRGIITAILILIAASIASAQPKSNFNGYSESSDTVVVFAFEYKYSDHRTYEFLVNLDADEDYARFYIPFINASVASITYSMTPDTTEIDSAYTHLAYGSCYGPGGTIDVVEILQDSTRYWYGSTRTRAVNLFAPEFPAPYLCIDTSTSKGSSTDNESQWVYIHVYVRYNQ